MAKTIGQKLEHHVHQIRRTVEEDAHNISLKTGRSLVDYCEQTKYIVFELLKVEQKFPPDIIQHIENDNNVSFILNPCEDHLDFSGELCPVCMQQKMEALMNKVRMMGESRIQEVKDSGLDQHPDLVVVSRGFYEEIREMCRV